MSVAVDSVAYLWHRGGEVVAVHRLLGNSGGLLLEVKGDDGARVEVEVPEAEVVELVRVLVSHVRDYGLDTGDPGVDGLDYGLDTGDPGVDGLEVVFDETAGDDE